MASGTLAPAPAPPVSIPRRSSTASWPLLDRAGYALCWLTGIGLCLIATAIVLYMLVKGISYLKLNEFLQSPSPSLHQTQSGGFSDPIVGTLLVTAIGTVLAAPVGVALASWLSEYGRPAWLARTVESALEMMAGVPSVVLAIFGLLVFSHSFLGFLSQKAFNGTATGQSFLAAGAVMSVLALPLIVASTREALAQLPDRLREASYALGRTRATTIRRVLLPAIRPSIASGVVLGMGRIVGDTAIITLILGATLKNEPADGTPILGALRGTGSTLTSYVYNNSPAGEGNSHEKAYAAAFVLLMIVLVLNALVTVLTGGRRERPGPATPQVGAVDPMMPPPVRRIVLEREPYVAPPRQAGAATAAPQAPAAAAQRLRPLRSAAASVRARMALESVWLAYGENWVVRDVSLPVRQGEVLALIGASGSGKTTLLRSLNRLTEVTAGAARSGQITLDGEEIHTLEVNDLRRRVSMVFQQPNPFPMSIFDNVAYALVEHPPKGGRRRRRSPELERAVHEALRRAGLYEEVADDLDRSALRLSGGQQQRLCIARALAAEPEVLLLDEPCSALDPISTATIEELIVELRETVAIVIVTHNLQQAFRVADHVAFMHLGELVEYGPSEQVFDRPAKQRTRDYVSGAFG